MNLYDYNENWKHLIIRHNKHSIEDGLQSHDKFSTNSYDNSNKNSQADGYKY